MVGLRVFGSKEMTGQTLFLKKNMTGQALFWVKEMTGLGLFCRKRMTGKRLFMGWICTILMKSIEKKLCRLTFQDYEMGGGRLRLFSEKKMTGHK